MSFVSAQSKYIPNNTQSQRQFALGMYKPRNIPSTKMEAIKELPVSNDSFVNKVKWGEPTWFLFHTLSVKIKESEFLRVRKELLNCIYSICVNLPCPICAEHAKQYLDNTQNENRILKPYLIHDLNLIWKFASKKRWDANLQLYLINVFDKLYEPNGYTYSYIYGGVTTTSNNYYPMAGRNFWLSLKIDLK
jgi:hypothetical protein